MLFVLKANHLCEWVYDYSNKSFPYYYCRREHFPSRERQLDLLRSYLTPEDVPAPIATAAINGADKGDTNGAAAVDEEVESSPKDDDDSPPRYW